MSETSDSQPVKNETPKLDRVAAIYAALGGQPVLLRIPRGKKRPIDIGWDRIRWEDTQDPDYQAALREGNVGVYLGARSQLTTPAGVYHLCSIDVDEDAGMEPFKALNPQFSKTLITRGRRGGNIWLWVLKDNYPLFAKLAHARDDGLPDRSRPWGEWRTDGVDSAGKHTAFQTVIDGLHPEGAHYKRISDATRPLLCDFKDIVWPETLALPWRKSAWDELISAHGEAWHESKNGTMTLNAPFWVGKYATERDMLFEPEEGRFYEYNEERGLWAVDSEDSIRWKFCMDFKRVADQTAKPQLEVKRTNSFVQSLVNLLKGCTERREAFRREAGIIHLQNCMLDLRPEPPQVQDFAAKYFSRNQVPIALDETATCDRFLNELLRTGIEHEDDIELLQRWAGQLLLGVNLTQKIMLLTGTAGGGKSTLINVLADLIGRANVFGLRTQHLHERFELFAYIGKTLLVGADVPGNFLMTEGAYMLKALVGGDIIPAEKKSGETISITGDFNVALTSNSRLKVKGDGDWDAWRRRLMIINYNRPKPKHPRPHFAKELIASEASGILNWMIKGAILLLEEIAGNGAMRMTERQRERVDSLLSESDSVREFARKGLGPMSGEEVTSQELNAAYVRFCEERRWTPESSRKVESVLPDAILEVHRLSKRNDIQRDGKAQRGYRGLRILPTVDRDEEVATVSQRVEEAPFGE